MGQNKTGAETDVRKRAYYFSVNIIRYIDGLPRDLTGTVISKQLVRSAMSVGANLVEAKGASSRKDFINFYSYSLKSANETLYWLGLFRDAKQQNGENLAMLIQEAKELSKMIGACIVSLKKNV